MNASVELKNKLIHYYGNIARNIGKCEEIYQSMNSRDVVTFNSMMTVYVRNNEYNKAIQIFQTNNLADKNDDTSFVLILNVYSVLKDNINGNKICDKILKKDINRNDIKLNNALIHYFGCINNMEKGLHIYNSMKRKDTITYNSIMNIYLKLDQYDETLKVFFGNKFNKNTTSIIAAINACKHLKDTQSFDRIHSQYVTNILSNDYNGIELYTSLMDYFSNINDIGKCEEIFKKIKNNTIISFSVMLNAYKTNYKYQKAINLFFDDIFHNEKYHDKLDHIIYNIVLDCCSNLSSLVKGELIISELNKSHNQSILDNVDTQCSILGLHGKCGKIDIALDMFYDNINNTDNHRHILLLFSSIMDVYCKNGEFDMTLTFFEELQTKFKHINPDRNIYGIVLNSCSHAGYIDKALTIFNIIKTNSTIMDTHILTSIIDCLSRNNQIMKAINIYNEHVANNSKYYYKDKVKMLSSILSFCNIHNDILNAEYIVHIIEQLYIKHDSISNIKESIYILLSNLYGKNKNYQKKERIHQKMKHNS